VDIGHRNYWGLVEPNTAFWALVHRAKLDSAIASPKFLQAYRRSADRFQREMNTLRFGLKPSAVYFNPTERCNLNCRYCYIPAGMRRHGRHMDRARLLDALARLKRYFRTVMPDGRLPQIVFHGAEPLLNKEAVFAGIEKFKDDFRFGVQTNATLLDEASIRFLIERGVGIGLSLDGPDARITDRTRYGWTGGSVHQKVVDTIRRLKGYPGFNVICTITTANLKVLSRLVEFLHAEEVPVCLLNIVRCTLPPSREVKPRDHDAAHYYLAALEKSWKLYRRTGRKLVVGNFANILASILAPSARRLMCDISPCGGGRCFFALAPNGDLFPCSEFIGVPRFKGGNLFRDPIPKVLESEPFRLVTERDVDRIHPCRQCAIRHFCGSPCPAEAYEMNGGMDQRGAFCEFYEEQVRYAFRLIAGGRAEDFMWDGWDRETRPVFQYESA
jgi:uncharacterized protein